MGILRTHFRFNIQRKLTQHLLNALLPLCILLCALLFSSCVSTVKCVPLLSVFIPLDVNLNLLACLYM